MTCGQVPEAKCLPRDSPQPPCHLWPLLPLQFQAEQSDLSSGELEHVTLKPWVGLCYYSSLKQVLCVRCAAGLTWIDAVLYGIAWTHFFGCHNLGVLLPSSGWRPGMLLNIPQRTGQPLPRRSGVRIQELEVWRWPCLLICLLERKK